MVCEFKKQNGGENNRNGRFPIPPEKERIVVIPRYQTELDRRRSARREQPRDPKKKPNKS